MSRTSRDLELTVSQVDNLLQKGELTPQFEEILDYSRGQIVRREAEAITITITIVVIADHEEDEENE